MRLAYFGIPHVGGTYSVYRALRSGLLAHGIAVRWLGVGPRAAAVIRDDLWQHERTNGEVVAADAADENQQVAQEVIDHLAREGYDGVIVGIVGARLQTNLVRYLPRRMLRLLIVHTTSPGAYAAARTIRDHVHATVGVSPRIREDLIDRAGFDHARTFSIFNGIDLAPYPNRSPRETSGPLRAVFLGRLEDGATGIYWLPKIISALAGVDVRLTIAGDGPDRVKLEAKCAPFADRIELVGSVRPEDVPRFLAGQDILLMPSRFEGFGYTLVEAMAAGCVSVASRIRGVTDTVVHEGTDGLLFPIGDVNAAADAIRRLAPDRVALQRMSEAARRNVQGRFSTEVMAARYAAIMRSVREAPPPILPSLPIDRWRYPAGLKPGIRTYLPTGFKNKLRVWRERFA